ncbi:MAG: hypothetical protein DBX47_04165 [Clostridiales bacterium]|nr:MAG: hypothetical protein DBX47_04165 [Clostridiales bacterium]
MLDIKQILKYIAVYNVWFFLAQGLSFVLPALFFYAIRFIGFPISAIIFIVFFLIIYLVGAYKIFEYICYNNAVPGKPDVKEFIVESAIGAISPAIIYILTIGAVWFPQFFYELFVVFYFIPSSVNLLLPTMGIPLILLLLSTAMFTISILGFFSGNKKYRELNEDNSL